LIDWCLTPSLAVLQLYHDNSRLNIFPRSVVFYIPRRWYNG